MRRKCLSFVSWLALVATCCGGRVESDSDDEPPHPAPSGSRDGRGGGADLGECRLGFDPGEETTPCNWVFDGRCYESKIEACACACPPDRRSTCSSGFPVADGRVEISCF